MKCPYCGYENEGNKCRKCSAMIPEKNTDKDLKVDEPTQRYEPIRVRKKNKEMKEYGT